MNTRKMFFERRDALFYIAYTMYFMARYLESTSFQVDIIRELAFLCKNFSYILCVAVIAFNFTKLRTVSLRQILVHGIILFLIAYQVVVNGGKGMFVVFLFSYAFGDRDFKTFSKVSFWLSIICFFGTILYSVLEITRSVSREVVKMDMIWRRESLGFIYPGELMMKLIPIILLFYYLNAGELRKVKNLHKNLFWLLMIALLFLVSLTIMPAFECVVFILFVLCVRNIEKWRYLYWIAPICAVITVVLVYMQIIGVPLAEKMNEITNHRLFLGEDAYEKYGISWWGCGFQNIDNGTDYLVLDSEYMFMIISNGIIYTILAVLLLGLVIKWAYEKRDAMLVWVLVFYAVHAIFNNGIYNLLMNPFMIIVCRAINDFCAGDKNVYESSINGRWAGQQNSLFGSRHTQAHDKIE